MANAVQQGAGQALGSEGFGPFFEGQVACDQGRAALRRVPENGFDQLLDLGEALGGFAGRQDDMLRRCPRLAERR